MFNRCVFAKALYEAVAATTDLNLDAHRVQARYTDDIIDSCHSIRSREILVITQFVLWRERGARIFRETTKQIQQLVQEVVHQLLYMEMKDYK